MADVRLRDFASLNSGRLRGETDREPVAPPIPFHPASSDAGVLVTPAPTPAPVRAVFGDAKADDLDAPEIDAALVPLAELAAHRATRGPLCIGLVGAPGAGKSFALARLSTHIRDLAAAAAQARRSATETPFLSSIHVQSIDAAGLDAGPISENLTLALAARLRAGLRATYPVLVQDIDGAARDPHAALRDATEQLDEMRRRLDTERRALEDAGSRRARLIETTLYDASGSQVDAYARANSTLIESRLNGFGLRGDAIRTYKNLVQLATQSGGKVGLALRSVWAFQGQIKLIVATIAFVAIGIGLGLAITDQPVWLESLRGGAKPGPWLADWFELHAGLLATLQTTAFGLAALALLANLGRALRFVQPILKGARLLEGDLEHRRNDLDGLYAHQTKRVDTLERDVERLTQEVTALERRVETVGPDRGLSHFDVQGDAAQAERLFAAINAAIGTAGVESPQRIILAIDHLDSLPPARAAALIDALHRITGPSIVTLVGFDPGHLDPDGLDELERWVQVPCHLDALVGHASHERVMRNALGRGEGRVAIATPEARQSALDEAFNDAEDSALASLAELAGRTPRAVRRFASLYTIARIGVPQHRGLLAFMVALAQGGTEEERRLVAAALAGDPTLPFDPPQSPRLSAALAEAIGTRERITRAEAAEIARRATTFSFAPPLAD